MGAAANDASWEGVKLEGSDERCLLSMGAEVILAISGGIEGSGPTYAG